MRALCLASALLLVVGSPLRAVELKGKDLTVVVARDGCGFVDSVAFQGREVVRSRAGFVGGQVALAAAGKGTAASLFRHETIARLPARLVNVEAAAGTMRITGAYSDGSTRIPFTRELRAVPAKSIIAVREDADFSGLGERFAVASHVLALPLVVCEDEHLRMLAFGGERRVEMFRMDQNDERRRNQLISDNRAFWPYWDLGGVVQSAGSYHLWRANHADTMAYPIEYGRGAPGWADYSELDWGVTVKVADPQKAAPWAIQIDARKGVLSLAPHPPSEMPVAGKELGKREIRFELVFHESSWPAACPCELDFGLYKKLLAALSRGGRYTHLDYACGGLGIQVKSGPKTAQEMQDVYRRVIFTERVQPSVLLRLLYRGDAWRMQGLVREVLGRRVPRNQPLAAWERLAAGFFAKIRRNGLPESPGR